MCGGENRYGDTSQVFVSLWKVSRQWQGFLEHVCLLCKATMTSYFNFWGETSAGGVKIKGAPLPVCYLGYSDT